MKSLKGLSQNLNHEVRIHLGYPLILPATLQDWEVQNLRQYSRIISPALSRVKGSPPLPQQQPHKSAQGAICLPCGKGTGCFTWSLVPTMAPRYYSAKQLSRWAVPRVYGCIATLLFPYFHFSNPCIVYNWDVFDPHCLWRYFWTVCVTGSSSSTTTSQSYDLLFWWDERKWGEEIGRGKEKNTRVMIYHIQLDCWPGRHNLFTSHHQDCQ